MKRYELSCNGCRYEFTVFLANPDDGACPKCGGKDVTHRGAMAPHAGASHPGAATPGAARPAATPWAAPQPRPAVPELSPSTIADDGDC